MSNRGPDFVAPLDKKTTETAKKIVVNEVRGRKPSEKQLEAIRTSKEGSKLIKD